MKIGLLGGTFNPIHIGHLILAQECLYQLSLDKVIFVPANLPPHKKISGKVSKEDRLRMVRLALRQDKRFDISTYEIQKKGPSYSIDTIKYFKKRCGKSTKLFFLAGADAAKNLSTWKDIDQILELTRFVIASRPGWGQDSPYERSLKRIVIPEIDVSSSGIRERLRKKKPIDYMVPTAVVKYIHTKGLYSQ